MQLHTFIVDSAAEAVERIRHELGPEAVVLSVRRLPRAGLARIWKTAQVEVVAGVEEADLVQTDPFEQLRNDIRELKEQIANGARLSDALPSLADGFETFSEIPNADSWRIARLLTQTGILPLFAEQITNELVANYGPKPPDTLAEEIAWAQEYLRRRWVPSPPSAATTHVFIGPPGSGKSTVLCKWLAQSSLLHAERTAVYQLDLHIANSSTLPGIYAEIVGASFERSIPFEWENNGLSFIDLPGFDPGDSKACAQFNDLLHQIPNAEAHLVLNAAYDSAILIEQARRWSTLRIKNIIFTHLDEEPRWGKLWNLLLGMNFSLKFLSIGQNIPGELPEASPERLLTRQFGPE